MSRKIEWNPNHKSADQQQSEFVDNYLSWPASRKWEYLMELASQGLKKTTKKADRTIEWK